VDYAIPSHVSLEAKDLIKNILILDPIKRYSIEEIRNHIWFSINTNKKKAEGEGLIVGLNTIPIDFGIVNEMRRMGYDQQLVIKCLDANQCNAISTTYYLLLKKNYYMKGNIQVMMRNFNALKTPVTKKRPKTKCNFLKV
jgi:5'-AMP-activated protein kinase catalytic alpha subunit